MHAHIQSILAYVLALFLSISLSLSRTHTRTHTRSLSRTHIHTNKHTNTLMYIDNNTEGKTKRENSNTNCKDNHGSSSLSSSSCMHESNTGLLVVLLVSWLFYQLIWHGVLSNLPLADAHMAYAVHARFFKIMF